MSYLLFHRGINITEIVGDFIKDEVGNWWLVNIKAFKMVERISRLKSPKSQALLSQDDLAKNSEQLEKERYQKTKLCRYCEKTYLES